MNKRIVLVFSILMFSFGFLLLRVGLLGNSSYSVVSERRSTRTVVVGESRGKIFDRNYKPLVEEKSYLRAVVTPCPPVIDYLNKYMPKEEILEKIEDGYPFIIEPNEKINNEIIRTFSVPVRYGENSLASHIIGYVNSDGNGVTGIEKSFDTFLKENSGKLTVSFQVDGRGRVLSGGKKTINDENYTSKAGVVLTIDKEIQALIEKALEESEIKSGCALVLSAYTGEILALSSYPVYNQNDVASYLNSENSPLLNKALLPYACGSVFKPLVSAAALEYGIEEDFTYKCRGKIEVGDKTFSCYENKKHGKITMAEALACSCNTYFINLIMNMDTELLLSLCKKVGIDSEEKLCDYIAGKKGALPTEDDLKTKGELANFSFGQGKLLLTPLKLAEIYSLISTGNYVESTLIRGFTNYMGLMKAEKAKVPMKLISDSTVLKIRKMLKNVVSFGATNAKSKKLTLSGKTGTAQSGIFKNGKEVLRTWFAGFFPYENPEYIVVVMDENGNGGNVDCAPVFRKICEGIYDIG